MLSMSFCQDDYLHDIYFFHTCILYCFSTVALCEKLGFCKSDSYLPVEIILRFLLDMICYQAGVHIGMKNGILIYSVVVQNLICVSPCLFNVFSFYLYTYAEASALYLFILGYKTTCSQKMHMSEGFDL